MSNLDDLIRQAQVAPQRVGCGISVEINGQTLPVEAATVVMLQNILATLQRLEVLVTKWESSRD